MNQSSRRPVALLPALLMVSVFLVPPFSSWLSSASGKDSPTGLSTDPRTPVWIFWGPGWEEQAHLQALREGPPVSPRALRRLARVGKDASVVDPGNRPVPEAFLARLEEEGIKIRHASRLLRAVSVELTDEQRRRLEWDPDIAEVRDVRRWTRKAPPPVDPIAWTPPGGGRPRGLPGTAADTLPDPRNLTRGDYGPSWRQCQQLGVTTLHGLGYSGKGVLVCVLDTGAWVRHEAFRRADIVATRDFVAGGTNVGVEPNDPSDPDRNYVHMQDHGTYTWSALGGCAEGMLIGPAYRASFIFGRTEIYSSETRVEEDNYVAGLDWADSMGADVVSTSLGYVNFDNGFEYWPEEYDGRTAVTSRAAATLARRGIILATAAGNENRESNPAPNLITPADADSIITVGAVDSLGRVAIFSSRGPTADGRIKPDVCAMGVATVCATASDTVAGDTYGRVGGTSLATPLIGGLAALILEARPDWTPYQVLDALRRSGDNANTPDNNRGWGIPDGVDATVPAEAQLLVEDLRWIDLGSGAGGLLDASPSPGDTGRVSVVLRNVGSASTPPAWVSLLCTHPGVLVAEDSLRVEPIGVGQEVELTEAFTVALDKELAAPSQVPMLLRFNPEEGSIHYREVGLLVIPGIWQSLAAYPNPVRSGGTVHFDLVLPAPGPVDLVVFDLLGREVETPYQSHPVGARDRLTWTPSDRLPSGVYFARLIASGMTQIRRVIILK